MKCNVCRKREAVGVACSATGPISVAYCAECAASLREPYGAVVASGIGRSKMEVVATWYRPIVLASLDGRSVEQLFEDVAAFGQEYSAAE